MRSRLDLASASRAREAVALLFGILAFAAVLQITDPPAPGLDPDAASYLGAAESLVVGRGLLVPTADWWNADSVQELTHFPPGLPVARGLRIVLDGATGAVFAPAYREPRPALPPTAARPSPRR